MEATEEISDVGMVVRKLAKASSKPEGTKEKDLSFGLTRDKLLFRWGSRNKDDSVIIDPKLLTYLSHSNPCFEWNEEDVIEHRQSHCTKTSKTICDKLDCQPEDDTLKEVISEKEPHITDVRKEEEFHEDKIPDEKTKEIVKDLVKEEPLKKTCAIPHFGLILATLYGLSFSFINLLAKVMVNYHPITLVMYRFLIMMVPTVPFVLYSKEHPFPQGNRVGLMARAICGCFNLILRFVALSHIALADATVISYTSPVFIAIFARIFLKEHCGIFTSFVIMVSLSGVILVARPPFIFGMEGDYHNDMWGVAASFGGVLFSSGGVVAIRSLKGVHSSVVLLSSTLVSLIISASLMFALNVFSLPMTVNDGLLLIALGIMSFIAEVILTVALQYEEAGPVSICRTSEVVFAFTWQAVFFSMIPHYLSIIGAVLVVTAAIAIGAKKIVAGLGKDSKIRKILGFILI